MGLFRRSKRIFTMRVVDGRSDQDRARDVAEELERLVALRRSGALTAEEFTAAKATVLACATVAAPIAGAGAPLAHDLLGVRLLRNGTPGVEAITTIRAVTGLSAVAARKVYDDVESGSPRTLVVTTRDDATLIVDQLAAIGATVDLLPSR